ncbi:MAG: hypothetical protein ACOYS2_02675 [Patescibacteria group bacterium]
MKRISWLSLMLGLVLILGGCAAATGNNSSTPAAAPQLPENYTPPAVQPAPAPPVQPALQNIPIAYTVVGAKKRAGAVAKYMAEQGYQVVALASNEEVMGKPHGKVLKGVVVTSAPQDKSAGIFVPVSDKVVKEGLCDDQINLIRSLPKVKTVQGAPAPQVAPTGAPCSGPNCWPANPLGRYMTLTPLWDKYRFILNYRPGASFSNIVSVKLEYQNADLRGWHYGYTSWAPTVVLRNPAVSFPEAKARLDAMGSRIQAYFACVMPLKQGQPGNPGDSCFEVEFDLTTGVITKSEAPPNCQF